MGADEEKAKLLSAVKTLLFPGGAEGPRTLILHRSVRLAMADADLGNAAIQTSSKSNVNYILILIPRKPQVG
jgi:hypothetical protein